MSPRRFRVSFGLAALVGLLATAPGHAQVVHIIYNFTGGTADGQNPQAAVTVSGSTIFGMTASGGSIHAGTIFQIGTDGTGLAQLHSFSAGVNDGSTPTGSLTLSGSTLYGMTLGGGSASSDGTIFQINTDGTTFNLIHSFKGGASDGSGPLGSLVQSGSVLYGMTGEGGTANLGTAFKINTDGTGFAVLHSFTGGAGDGQGPSYATVVVSGNTLYGVTPEGGAAGLGVVFRVNTDGTGFTVLHSFSAATGDGWSPIGSLTLSGSTLYGMTRQGGGGAGTIFSINTDGSNYSRLHTFTGSNGDGANPVGTLLVEGSTLYGTTPSSGADGLGVLFDVNTDGTGYDVLHTFAGGPNDGANPGDLVQDGSAFFGITGAGGANNLGTIFEFTPIPEPSSLALAASVAFLALLGHGFRKRQARCSPAKAQERIG